MRVWRERGLFIRQRQYLELEPNTTTSIGQCDEEISLSEDAGVEIFTGYRGDDYMNVG